ncbi:MAG: OsmC family protein [Telluria sp.]
MTIIVRRDTAYAMRHTVQVRDHELIVDGPIDKGGDDAGPSPHDLYDAALGSCKALTLAWYARSKNIPLEDIEVIVTRDDSGERDGVYKLDTALRLGGPLTDAQRAELLTVAGKCPVHKLMTKVTTEITTRLA